MFATIIFDDVLSIKIPFEENYRDYPIDMRTANLETREGKRNFARRQMSMAEKLYDLEVSNNRNSLSLKMNFYTDDKAIFDIQFPVGLYLNSTAGGIKVDGHLQCSDYLTILKGRLFLPLSDR